MNTLKILGEIKLNYRLPNRYSENREISKFNCSLFWKANLSFSPTIL